MGVQISELVPKKQIELDDLKDKIIAIDASNTLYQFLSSIRQRDGTPLLDSHGNVTSHLQGLFTRTLNLMNRGIKVCYIFDGKPPALKFKTKEIREERKKIAEKKLRKARREEDYEAMSRYSKQVSRLTFDMSRESKELIKALGLPAIQAPSEAEAQAAFMCEKKDVDYVGSQDYDSLLFGAPRLVQNLTISQRRKLPSGIYVTIKPELILLKDVLNNLGINQDKLIVMGILVGTDYNPGGVKGIGPKNALRLVKTFHNFDELFKEVKADFNWKKIYAIFKSMPIMKNYQLKFNEIDENKVKKILVDQHDFSEERIDSLLQKTIKEKSNKQQKSLNKWFQ